MSTKKQDTKIKYGKIELPIEDGTDPHVPTNGGKFIDHGDILKTLAIGIRDNLPVLLIGESGTGKTSAIRFLASETKNGLRRINLNGGTTADELVGRLLINDKGTYWVDGVLTEAMRKGEWVVLDEINAALPEVLFVLQSILDDDGYLVLSEKDDKEIVRKHPNFRIFATCNPPEYAGTKEMNKALLSRFAICISADFPPASKEMDIIEYHLGTAIAKTELAEKLVGLANETRKAKDMGTADYAINTRDVLNTLRLSVFMEPIDALGLAFSNKLDSTDNKALKLIAKLHLPAKKGTKAAQKAIKSGEDMKIGNTYVLHADVCQAYYALVEKGKTQVPMNKLAKQSLSDILSNNQRQNGIKGDEFVVMGTYYENGEDTAYMGEPDAQDGNGEKIASLITITNGPNKDKIGIIPHHIALNGSEDNINNIYEIS